MKKIIIILALMTGMAFATDAFVDQSRKITVQCGGSRDSGHCMVAPPGSAWVDTFELVIDSLSSNDTVLIGYYTPTVEGYHDLRAWCKYNASDSALATGGFFAVRSVNGVGEYTLTMVFRSTADSSALSAIRPQLFSADGVTQYLWKTGANTSGVVTVGLDAGTYWLKVHENGYVQYSDSITISADAGEVVYLEPFSPGSPSDTGYCRVWANVFDLVGALEAATVTIDPITTGGSRWTFLDSTKTYIPKEVTFKTNSSGVATDDIPRSDYIISEDGDSLKYNVTIKANNNSFTWKKNKVVFTDSVYQLR